LAACSLEGESDPAPVATTVTRLPATSPAPPQAMSLSATASFQPSSTSTIPPPATPAECSHGWTRLVGWDFASVTPGLPNLVRSAPTTSGAVVSQLLPGSIVKALEGPRCADGYVYWKVEHFSIPAGAGWTAEGDLSDYFLEPVDWVTFSGRGVSFIMPGGWGCEAQAAAAGTNEYGHSWPGHIHIIFSAYPAFSEWLPGIYVYPTADLPASFVSPTFGAPLMVRAQVKSLRLGERAVSENGNIHPVFNSRRLYYYEGKTADGIYTVIAVLPVNAPFLPNSYNDPALPAGGIPFTDHYSFDWSAYYGQVQAQLDAAPGAVFTPTLEMLDVLVESILVEGPRNSPFQARIPNDAKKAGDSLPSPG